MAFIARLGHLPGLVATVSPSQTAQAGDDQGWRLSAEIAPGSAGRGKVRERELRKAGETRYFQYNVSALLAKRYLNAGLLL